MLYTTELYNENKLSDIQIVYTYNPPNSYQNATNPNNEFRVGIPPNFPTQKFPPS